MAPRGDPGPNLRPTTVSGRADTGTSPDLRILHYNDVYHVDPSSAEPVGGLARFMTLIKEYREGEKYKGQSELVTLFSGDAFNPSLESTVTKGRHMVPVLNTIGTDVACVGNHDFDFGVKQFQYLTAKTKFPWLLANVLDPALGENIPLGNAKRTHMLTSSNGIKIGLIGLGEREWLATINSLPPNLIYKSATETAKELVPKLREEGAEIVICVSHQREPNDNKLAKQTEGLFDMILGGHDHYYSHTFISGTHVLRSGSDFQQMSYIEAWRRPDSPVKWDFDIWRRDVTSEIAEDPPTVQLVDNLTAKLKTALNKPVGWTAMPLDARFSTVRTRESNIGNFVCDIMRMHHSADCTIMAAGTIRGGQIYPPGAIRIKDITNCFPFEDPVVLLRVTGKQIWDALENGVCMYPALEGRFPQVSNMEFEFDPSQESGKRITMAKIGGEAIDMERKYRLATRGYMGRGKDGFDSLLVESEGGTAEELIDEETGMLISTMLRQYFTALRSAGQWKNLSDHWRHLAASTISLSPQTSNAPASDEFLKSSTPRRNPVREAKLTRSRTWKSFLHSRLGLNQRPVNDDASSDEESDDDEVGSGDDVDFELLLMSKFWARWRRKVGVKGSVCDGLKEGEGLEVDWTTTIAPALEGRIKIIGGAHNVA